MHASAPDRARLIDTRKLDPRAYDLYLRGSYHLGRVTAQDTDQAIALYEQAAAIATTLINSRDVQGQDGGSVGLLRQLSSG